MATVAEKMTAIADAIRAKTSGTSKLTLDQMATEIAGITTQEPYEETANDYGTTVTIG